MQCQSELKMACYALIRDLFEYYYVEPLPFCDFIKAEFWLLLLTKK